MKSIGQPAVILRLLIGVAYIVLGAFLLFSNIEIALLTPTTKTAFSLLLVVYGLFRLYRVKVLLNETDE